MAIDTACSSSLVALDCAMSAIRSGKCHMAVVAGAKLTLRREWSDCFASAGMLSPTFCCRFGDDSADGDSAPPRRQGAGTGGGDSDDDTQRLVLNAHDYREVIEFMEARDHALHIDMLSPLLLVPRR